MLNFNNFSSRRPILDLNVFLDRTRQYLKYYLKGSPLGVTPWTIETIFLKFNSMIFKSI